MKVMRLICKHQFQTLDAKSLQTGSLLRGPVACPLPQIERQRHRRLYFFVAAPLCYRIAFHRTVSMPHDGFTVKMDSSKEYSERNKLGGIEALNNENAQENCTKRFGREAQNH